MITAAGTKTRTGCQRPGVWDLSHGLAISNAEHASNLTWSAAQSGECGQHLEQL